MLDDGVEKRYAYSSCILKIIPIKHHERKKRPTKIEDVDTEELDGLSKEIDIHLGSPREDGAESSKVALSLS